MFTNDIARFLLPLMAQLETLVDLFGDAMGITGAFICIEGMAAAGIGGQIGLNLVYHPDLGWALFYYAGYLWGAICGGGISLTIGFWTWHDEKKFTFDQWEKWFFSFETTAGIHGVGGSYVYFMNETNPPTITGWGIGPSMGIGGGVAGARAYFHRAFDYMIPIWARRIIIPSGKYEW